jgi:hypothetical protein
MLGLGSYLLGSAQILLLAGFAWLAGRSVRSRLVPELSGAPAHLATSVLAFAILIWSGELLGGFGLFEPLPYLLTVGAFGVGIWALLRGWRQTEGGRERTQSGPPAGPPPSGDGTRGPIALVPTLIALAVAAVAVLKFALETKTKLGTGMTGFDSTWYHGTFAAGFMQSGDTWDLHFIAPQFLAWFYPANSEVLHAVGMSAFERDLLSPLLNLGWFAGCLVACWCIGRPFGLAPWSLALGAVALSVPALSDQAGEARNDIVGIFFLLTAVAIALNSRAERDERALLLVALAAGLAAGTKLNFLLPAAVLVLGLVAIAPRGRRLAALAAAGLAALAGGGYWYLRNLVHTGNPLPWFDSIGPVSLPAPDQALGGREAHSVLSYLTDGAVWADWFLPGLRDGLWIVWPLLLGGALAGIGLSLILRHDDEGGTARVLRVAALTGLAAAVAWLLAPTSASGPEGMPRGFESGLRYLAPTLVLGLALLPTVPPLRSRLSRLHFRFSTTPGTKGDNARARGAGATRGAGVARGPLVGVAAALLVAIAAGYFVQREYLERRYADPAFATPGLNEAFALAGDWEGVPVATTSTRQYPLFGAALSNRVEFVGGERPRGGFVAPRDCRSFLRLLNDGGYTYVVASRDRIEPGKPPYPPEARWLAADPNARLVLRVPPTAVFLRLRDLDPSSCPR